MSGANFNVFGRTQKTLCDTIQETKCLEGDVACNTCGCQNQCFGCGGCTQCGCNCCCGSFSKSCPEASNVTINQNIIQYDGSQILCIEENITEKFNNRVAYLAYTPLDKKCVSLYLNGVFQPYGDCYTISGSCIRITFALDEEDSVHAKYKYLSDGSDNQVPDTVIYCEPPAKQCIMENVTAKAQANTTFELDFCPLSSECVKVFVNGVLQETPNYYSVSAADFKVITLVNAPDSLDNIVVCYEYYVEGNILEASPGSRIGIIEAFAGDASTCPQKALVADGSSIGTVGSGADFEGAQYRDLYNIIGTLYTDPVVVPDFDAGVVVDLPDGQDVFHDGTTLVQIKAIIWYED